MSLKAPHVVVVGAGMGGLSAAARLAQQGLAVTLLERAERVGGKVWGAQVGDYTIDAGPTVLTMRWVFDQLFEELGEHLDEHVALQAHAVLAHHYWSDGSQFTLYADRGRTEEAVRELAGKREAAAFRRFCQHARRIYETVEKPFIKGQRPTVAKLAASGMHAVFGPGKIEAHRSMWRALGDYFRDPRLRQLFARYATYYGSDPFHAPGTLNLIAHVEMQGVWSVRGGMHALAAALGELARRKGVRIHCGTEAAELVVEQGRVTGVRTADGDVMAADAVVLNGDVSALAGGGFGAAAQQAAGVRAPKERSLSALTMAGVARARGVGLSHHNVFFCDDYPGEFAALRAGKLPPEPTVYMCAQQRSGAAVVPAAGETEPIFFIINAPAQGDVRTLPDDEVTACQQAAFRLLRRCGLELDLQEQLWSTPSDFHRRFPYTGGALYGGATHGAWAPVQRPASRTALPGLYLTGGSVHPGAGVPMATLSGRLAAAALVQDLDSTSRFRQGATPGGTPTESAPTASSASP